MFCPFCAHTDTRVIDSRLMSDGDQVRRRRQCESCKDRFTTYERAELNLPKIVKHDGSRVPFDEDKLRTGVMRALEKRPVASDHIEAGLTRIMHWLMATGEREIPSRTLGEKLMAELREMDQVAYVRFASVYRSFEDVNEFREEVDRLENEPSAAQKREQIPLLPGE
jgi:transcriptional repressor NrdR